MLKKRCFLLLLTAVLRLAGQNAGPVAKYSFNGNTKDEAGSNDARAYNLAPTEDRFGNDGYAYFFPGNFDSYISLGSSQSVKPTVGSISLWVYIEQQVYKGRGVTSNSIIYTRAFGGEDFNEAYVIGYEFELKKLHANNSNSEAEQVALFTDKTARKRKWYHVVLTYDNDYSCFYMDGVLAAKAAKNFKTRFYESDSVLLGAQLGKKNRRCFHGVIDDVEIYDRVLSPKEVLALYNAPNPNRNAVVINWLLAAAGAAVVVLMIAWWVRRRIKRAVNAEKEKSRLNARILELETKALRAQMNPHFIFNSLNALQRFVLEDNKEKSYTYLSEFSRLLRKLLESSESEVISLEEEIDILRSYLEVEKLRFDNSFEYRINSDVSLPAQVYIPIMLIQPFAENAIWHGLLNKKGARLLSITFKDTGGQFIFCEVEDNGVGRKYKSQPAETIKKKSLALDLIRQRLELISSTRGVKASFEIVDKADAEGNSLGTVVKIVIPKM